MILPAAIFATANSSSSTDRGLIRQIFVDLNFTSDQAHTAQIYLSGPVRIVVILIVAFVLTRLMRRLSHRLASGLRLVSPLMEDSLRGTARVKTLAGAFTSVFRALIWLIASLEILGQFNINLAPFVATATVIGAAVGFGAQSLVKDFLSGILILAEDQYGVGDHIAIGVGSNMTSGTVESVNLRVTRLRGADGGILYVPNGDIRTLSNDTETDSQALVDFVVPLGTDLARAGRVAEAAARKMAANPEWKEQFEGQPYFAGVQSAIDTGVTLRIMALTRPGQHLRLAREMRLRVLEGLRTAHVAWVPPGTPVPDEAEGAEGAEGAGRATEEPTADAEPAGHAEPEGAHEGPSGGGSEGGPAPRRRGRTVRLPRPGRPRA